MTHSQAREILTQALQVGDDNLPAILDECEAVLGYEAQDMCFQFGMRFFDADVDYSDVINMTDIKAGL